MLWSLPHVLAVGVVLVGASFSQEARASHAPDERIPVGWDDAACMQVVDRSVNPVYEFTYSIFREDPEAGEEISDTEVADSRRHQFFAMCRQPDPWEWLPFWITDDDVAAALAKGLIGETSVDPRVGVLANHPGWDGCFERINPDDGRFPISFESTDGPVQWDTTGIPEGVYQLWGYTWQPPFNLWAPQRGVVVQVFDGGDPAQSGPAGAITTGEIYVYPDEAVSIEGCANGLPGTTVTGYVALSTEAALAGEPSWQPFSEAVEVTDGTFSLDLMWDDELGGNTVLVRVDVTDPEGRTYRAHMFDLVAVFGVPDDCGGSFVGAQDCTTTQDGGMTDAGGSGGTTAGGVTADGTTGRGPQGAEQGSSSGGCTVGRPAKPWEVSLMLMGVLCLARCRRRERRPV